MQTGFWGILQIQLIARNIGIHLLFNKEPNTKVTLNYSWCDF